MVYSHIHLGRSETIEDAVTLLRQKSPTFAEHGDAEVRIGALKYPDFVTRPAVILLGPPDSNGSKWSIGMASAERFTGKQALRPDLRQTFYIEHLDHARVDELGNVTLADTEEMHLYDVRLIPTEMAKDLTGKEKEALLRALAYIDEEETYLYDVRLALTEIAKDLKQAEKEALLGELVDEKRIIDYSILPQLGQKLPPLKQLPDYNEWREHYRSAFLKTGMRRPHHGKHAASKSLPITASPQLILHRNS
jgi:hypothetical protein